MPNKVTLTSIANLQNENTAVSAINANSTQITAAMNNTLSRDGTSPNQMQNILDMNNQQIINLPAPTGDHSPVRLIDIVTNPTFVPGGTGTSGHTIPFLDGNNTFSGDDYFKSGRPWTDVRAWGAIGNGLANDTTAFQNAIDYSQTLNGGIVYVPPGEYALKTGITIPNFVRLVGSSEGSVVIHDGGNNTNPVITITGFRAHLENLDVLGCGRFGTSDPFPLFPAVLITNSNQDGVYLKNCTFAYGNVNVRVMSQDVVLDNCSLTQAYGTSMLEIPVAGQVWAHRCILDQGWPVIAPNGASPPPTAWAPNTTYAVGALVTNGSNYLQCSAIVGDAKSAGSAPTLTPLYGTPIVDNHVTWLLVCNTQYAAVVINSGENYFNQCDFSGCYTYGINIGPGVGGCVVGVHNSIIGQVTTYGIRAIGTGPTLLFVNNCQLSAGWLGGAGISIGSSFNGNTTIQGCIISGGVGVHLDSTSATAVISNNIFGGCSHGVFSEPNVGNFMVSNNYIGNPPNLGQNNNAVFVSAGTADQYTIVNNMVRGSSAGITDGGTGIHKTVTGNVS